MRFTYSFIVGAVSLLISTATYGQLKIDQLGHIGMGTNWPNPGYMCHIKGNLLLSNHPESPTSELQLKTTTYGSYIGSNRGSIRFWSSYSGYLTLYAKSFSTVSDPSVKSNITPLEKGLSELMKITPYSYNLHTVTTKEDTESTEKAISDKRTYGFLSTEIAKSFPEFDITVTAEGVRLMDYNQIIPILVASVKEQQEIISLLEEKINDLESTCCNVGGNGKTTGLDESLNSSDTRLYQNNPNPFNERTKIKYTIVEESFHSGSILIFDMNGTLIKTYPASKGENELMISQGELKAGMYIYTLIVNDKEVDSKRMILME